MTRKFTWRFFAGLVSLLVWVASAAAQDSIAIARDPSGTFGKFAYVANSRSNSVTMYTIDPATGALTSIGTIGAGKNPISVAVDPSGKFVYVVNNHGFISDELSDVSMYTIDASTGALTFIGSVATGGVNSLSVAVDPTGKFAYVANQGGDFNGGVTMYTIDAVTGALTSTGVILAPCVESPPSCTPYSVAVHPSGRFAYVANEASVSVYLINATTGTLAMTQLIASGGIGGLSVAVDPTGKFAYVVDGFLQSNVSMYSIDPTTGDLRFIGVIDAGSSPTSIAIDPSGRFAYVTNSRSNDVSMYRIDGGTGALTLIGVIDGGRFLPQSPSIRLESSRM
jgi:6-phosphogluconolactonase